jgi:hypothetical protein
MGYLLMEWGNLKPEVIRKTHPRPILVSTKGILGHGCLPFPYRERAIRGHNQPVSKKPPCNGPLRAQTHNIFSSILLYSNLST